MFKTRLLSGIVLLLILASALFVGNEYLWGLTFAISMVGLFEFYRAVRKENQKKSLEIVGYAGAIVYYLVLLFAGEVENLFLVLILTVIVMMFIYVFTYPVFVSTELMSTVFGILYVPVMLSFVYLTRSYQDGKYLVWLILLSSWICDTCAYCVGMLIGKHKLAPVLSPKKSIEGAVGGMAGSAIAGALYGGYLVRVHGQRIEIIFLFAIISALGAIVSQVGDLTASAIKRNHEIKDYGNLIPGHGGILDRFDSVIVTAPMIYMLAIFLIGKAGL